LNMTFLLTFSLTLRYLTFFQHAPAIWFSVTLWILLCPLPSVIYLSPHYIVSSMSFFYHWTIYFMYYFPLKYSQYVLFCYC
jgi:hypothetical protein